MPHSHNTHTDIDDDEDDDFDEVEEIDDDVYPYNYIDRQNRRLTRRLVLQRGLWKHCEHRICRRARRCAVAKPECQGVREICDGALRNLNEAHAFACYLKRRLAGKPRPIKRVRWYGEDE